MVRTEASRQVAPTCAPQRLVRAGTARGGRSWTRTRDLFLAGGSGGDLAIGTPGEDSGSAADSGAVQVLFGTVGASRPRADSSGARGARGSPAIPRPATGSARRWPRGTSDPMRCRTSRSAFRGRTAAPGWSTSFGAGRLRL